MITHKLSLFYIVRQFLPGADLGGQGGQCPPSKNFYLYVTATVYSMKILFNAV